MKKHGILAAYLLLLIVQAFNPLNKTVFHGLLGIIMHSVFWLVSFYYLDNRDKFYSEKPMSIFLILAFGEIILASIQYQLPPTNILNRYADENYTDIAIVGNAVRVTGTFSFIAGFTSYLVFQLFLVWALVKINFKPAITLLLLLLSIVGTLMSGSRAALYINLIVIFFMIITEWKNFSLLKNAFKLVVPITVLVMVVLIYGNLGVSEKIQTAYDNYAERFRGGVESGEQSSRFSSSYMNLIDFRGKYPLFGIGLGATYQGATALFGTSDALEEYGFVESENEKVLLEGGYILFFFEIILMFSLCRQLYVPMPVKIMIGILIFMNPPLYNVYNSIFMFLGISLLDNIYYRRMVQKPVFA